jgi:hypothetical protein
VWGAQVEYGSKATPFQTATGTLQGELAACQRYFSKSYNVDVAPATSGTTVGMKTFSTTSTTDGSTYGHIKFPVSMRITPTVTVYSFNAATSKVSNAAGGTDQGTNSGIASYIGQDSFAVFNSSGGTVTTTGGAIVHYAASAEL